MRNVSLGRALSKLGFTSRSLAGRLITEGKVSVNGRVITSPAFRCDLQGDRILVDGKGIGKKRTILIMLNKPRGVVTTRSDELNRKSIYDLLGDIRDWVFPVGRLDKESEGLLICTNDNALGEALTGPAHRIQKIYRVECSRAMSEDDTSIFEKGMTLDGMRLLPARIGPRGKLGDRFWFEITLTEGKNRQIRKMCEARGIEVLALRRLAIGPIKLGDLAAGSFRHLEEREEKMLRHAIGRSATSPGSHRPQRKGRR